MLSNKIQSKKHSILITVLKIMLVVCFMYATFQFIEHVPYTKTVTHNYRDGVTVVHEQETIYQTITWTANGTSTISNTNNKIMETTTYELNIQRCLLNFFFMFLFFCSAYYILHLLESFVIEAQPLNKGANV